MEIIQSIALDFAQNATQATVFAKQYDKDTRKIEITPLNNGSPYTIDTDVTARLQMTKSDGTTVINNAEISSGKITVVLTAQALTSAGTAVAEIGLYKGSTLLSSQTFYIDVQKGAYDEDAPESSDEYNALVEALGEAEQATATAEAASERAEAAVDSANTAIETARTVATGKMSLIPIDPTVEEIEAMPSGQLYSDTVNHKGIVKDGQEFYDTEYIDEALSNKQNRFVVLKNLPIEYSSQNNLYQIGDIVVFENICYRLDNIVNNVSTYGYYRYIWKRPVKVTPGSGGGNRPSSEERTDLRVPSYNTGDLFFKTDIYGVFVTLYRCKGRETQWGNRIYPKYTYEWEELKINKDSLAGYGITDAYTKTEIDAMIGDIESLLAEV